MKLEESSSLKYKQVKILKQNRDKQWYKCWNIHDQEVCMSTFEFTIDNCILINKQQIKFYTRHLSDRKNSKEIAGEKKFILLDINF